MPYKITVIVCVQIFAYYNIFRYFCCGLAMNFVSLFIKMGKGKEIVQENTEMLLFSDVCGIIDNGRKRIAVYVNSEICLTKWHVGKRIKEDVLYNQRAEYGKQIVKNLAAKLTTKYGSGWNLRNIQHCLRVAYTFSEEERGCIKMICPLFILLKINRKNEQSPNFLKLGLCHIIKILYLYENQ